MAPITLRQPITSAEELREIIGTPGAPAIKKQIDHLDEHCRRFIALAPLLFISSANADGQCDVSPKGDAPGFVHVLDDKLLAIPERAGNRRTDTLRNILANPQVGLIFVIPGMRELLRINGRATIYRDHELLEAMTFQGRRRWWRWWLRRRRSSCTADAPSCARTSGRRRPGLMRRHSPRRRRSSPIICNCQRSPASGPRRRWRTTTPRTCIDSPRGSDALLRCARATPVCLASGPRPAPAAGTPS